MQSFYFFNTIFPIMFLLVFGIIIFNILRGVKEWHNNNQQPVLDVPAKVVSKRNHISRSSSNHNGHHHGHTRTTYYVTFEVESGDRMELHVPSKDFGLLAEGDIGKLTFQGTRFHKFERYKDIQ